MDNISNEHLTNLQIVNKYKEVTRNMLRHSFPDLSPMEIEKALDFSIIKRMKNNEATLHNNYKDVTLNTTLLEMAEWILQQEPIITARGVFFKKHGTEPNLIVDMVAGFMENRGIFKKKMLSFPKGSEDFAKYNLLQLLAKIDANALVI